MNAGGIGFGCKGTRAGSAMLPRRSHTSVVLPPVRSDCLAETMEVGDMLGKAVRDLLRNPVGVTAAVVSDPLEAWIAFQERLAEHRDGGAPPGLYHADPNWERRLHELLNVSSPCTATAEFWMLWDLVKEELEAKGIRVGPMSYKGWNDGDLGLLRSIWCLIKHRRPTKVVETGVGHGVTTRFILEALKSNGGGHLWSIDYPPLDTTWHTQIGIAVGDRFADQWTYIRGSSRRRLPTLLSSTGPIGLFVHDSLHSANNVRFELGEAWSALTSDGAIVVDDIDCNRGFQLFMQSFDGYQHLVCESEPVHPDPRRFNKKGQFGIIVKAAAAQDKVGNA